MSGPNSEYDPVQVTPLDEEHVTAMREEALAAIAAATDLDALKRVRTEHAGDRSPLALANREIGALPPQARKDAGRRVGQARGAVNQALAAAPGRARGRGRAADARRGDRRRHAALGPRDEGRPAPDHDAVRAHRRRLRRDGLGGRRGPARRGRVAELRRAQPRSRPPGAHDAGHLLDRSARAPPRAAHAHLTGAGAHDARPASHRSTSSARVASSAPTSTTPRTARCSTRSRASSSTEGITMAHLKGSARPLRRGDLRRGDHHALPPVVLPVHRAQRRGRPALLRLPRPAPGRRGLPHLQGRGLDRVGWLRRGQPAGARPPAASTTSATPASRSAWASTAP